MFALLAGTGDPLRAGALEAVAGGLLGGPAPRLWRDPLGRGGAAATVPGILPEDVFDAQPLRAGDRVLVGRARLDNRAELLAKLGQDGEGLADSHLLFLAQGRWGDECLRELVGDFAFIVWNPGAETLTAAVDPFGAARLYWARCRGGLALSGELGALLGHPELGTTPDLEALAQVLDMGLDRTRTAYRDIHSLPGGHRLRWKGGQIHIERWWQPENRPLTRFSRGQDYVDLIGQGLGAAVKAQVRTSGGVASTLSGGLDSGLVTSMAASRLEEEGRGLLACTAIPEPGLSCSDRPGWEPDDRGYAASLAALHANVHHLLLAPGGRCSLDLLPDLFDRARMPMKSLANLLWIEGISRVCRQRGARVVLEGQMGNGTVSWPGAGAVSELFTLLRFGEMAALARREARADGRPLWRVLAGGILGAGAPGRFLRGLRARPQVSPSLAFLKPHHRPARRHPEPSGGHREDWVAFVLTPKNIWRPDPLVHWGVEWRDPMTDRRVVEALLTFPLEAFRCEGLSRGLARALGRNTLPESTRLRRTKGAQVPEIPALILRSGARYRAALGALAASGACGEFLDVPALGAALETLLGGCQDYYLAMAVDRAFGVGLFLVDLEGRRP